MKTFYALLTLLCFACTSSKNANFQVSKLDTIGLDGVDYCQISNCTGSTLQTPTCILLNNINSDETCGFSGPLAAPGKASCTNVQCNIIYTPCMVNTNYGNGSSSGASFGYAVAGFEEPYTLDFWNNYICNNGGFYGGLPTLYYTNVLQQNSSSEANALCQGSSSSSGFFSTQQGAAGTFNNCSGPGLSCSASSYYHFQATFNYSDAGPSLSLGSVNPDGAPDPTFDLENIAQTFLNTYGYTLLNLVESAPNQGCIWQPNASGITTQCNDTNNQLYFDCCR